MAHKSLSLKLEARREQAKKLSSSSSPVLRGKSGPRGSIWGGACDPAESIKLSEQLAESHPSYENAQMKMVDAKGAPILDDDHQCEFAYKRPRAHSSLLDTELATSSGCGCESILESETKTNNETNIENEKACVDNRVDKVYTIGCFDLFHHGHVQLIKRMREIGKKVIVGVHDSRRCVHINVSFVHYISHPFFVFYLFRL